MNTFNVGDRVIVLEGSRPDFVGKVGEVISVERISGDRWYWKSSDHYQYGLMCDDGQPRNGFGVENLAITDILPPQADSAKPEGVGADSTAENLHNEWIAEKIRFQDRFTELTGKCQSYEDQLAAAREQVARLRALEVDNVRLLEAVDTIYALLQTLPIGGTYTIEQHATVGKAYDLSSLIRRTISRPIAAVLAGDEGGA